MSLYLLDVDGLSHVRNFTGATNLVAWPDSTIIYHAENCEAEIMRKVGMQFYDTQIEEWHDGDGSKLLTVKNFPLRSVDELILDDVLIDSCCYYVYYDKALIYLKTGYFTEDYHNIKVTYTYGAPSAEDAIKFRLARKIAFKATCKEVLLEKGSRESHGFVDEKMEQYSLSYGKGPYALTLDQLDRDIEKAYKTIGITVEARIL